MRGFTPFHNEHNPYGWTDLEYKRAKEDTKAQLLQYSKLSKTNPDGHTLDYGETDEKNSGATNKVKYNELVDYAKEINLELP